MRNPFLPTLWHHDFFMLAAVWFLRSSAWDIIAFEFLIVHFKSLGGGELKSAAIIFFSFPHPTQCTYKGFTCKQYMEKILQKIDKYYI